MSVKKTAEEVIQHKNDSLKELDMLIQSMLSSKNEKEVSRADKLCYWLRDWAKFLEYEHSFTPTKLKRYKHGDIIKVHLGFNIGSEEGGLHYAVVAEKNNSLNSPVVTIVPLTSIKEKTNLAKLKPGMVNLGAVLYNSLNLKLNTLQQSLQQEIDSLNNIIEQLKASSVDPPANTLVEINDRLDLLGKQMPNIDAMMFEIGKMKAGSIALVNQITTISKIRIRDPKDNMGVLSGIRLPDDSLDLIDAEIIKMFTNFKT